MHPTPYSIVIQDAHRPTSAGTPAGVRPLPLDEQSPGGSRPIQQRRVICSMHRDRVHIWIAHIPSVSSSHCSDWVFIASYTPAGDISRLVLRVATNTAAYDFPWPGFSSRRSTNTTFPVVQP